MKLGIDVLLSSPKLLKELAGKRIALLGHPASVTSSCEFTLDKLCMDPHLNVVAAFGPQHGMRGDKQDNMIESSNYIDPTYHIQVFSLYGQVRRPTEEMIDTFDVLLIDLQDVGTRIYTFLTTLFYMIEACAKAGKTLWILDRPNPAGRPIEGTILQQGWESFVGAGPAIMRHGMTLGELAIWYKDLKRLDINFQVIKMQGYKPNDAPGFGWPLFQLPWINPSPNASSLNMARCYPGTVLFEGTTLSEGRGTTAPLEIIGAPDINFISILKSMNKLAPDWLNGCYLRTCFFEPTFHKYKSVLCSGIQIHTDFSKYVHEKFKPYRIAALIFKAIRLEYPDYRLWHTLPYEYETDRLAIDLLSGGTILREWVDDPCSKIRDIEHVFERDEQMWLEIQKDYLLY